MEAKLPSTCKIPLHIACQRRAVHQAGMIMLLQAYGRELTEAGEWCRKYRVSRKDSDLHQAWDLYYHVFKRINKQLPQLTTLELQYVAPALVRAQVNSLQAKPGFPTSKTCSVTNANSQKNDG